MSDQYPRMMYKEGGDQEIWGKHYTTRVVVDEAEEQKARAGGFRSSLTDAEDAAPDGDDLREELNQMRLRAEAAESDISDLRAQLQTAQARATAAEAERDEVRELLAAFDGDKDGKPGGRAKKAGS